MSSTRVKQVIKWGLSSVGFLKDDEIQYLGIRGMIDPYFDPNDTFVVTSPLMFIWGVEFTSIFELPERFLSLWSLCVAPFPLNIDNIGMEACYELVSYDNFDNENLLEMISGEEDSETFVIARRDNLEGWMVWLIKERGGSTGDQFLLALLMERKYDTVKKMMNKGISFSPELRDHLVKTLKV